MQVFVRKSDIGAPSPVIMGSYEDTPTMGRDLHGPDCTVLSVPKECIVYGGDQAVMQLSPDWRTKSIPMVVNQEAQRRILESFADYMQRNSSQDSISSSTLYGSTIANWPQDAKDRHARGQVGWEYIVEVRAASDTMITEGLPLDPTADSEWPTRIPPVYI